MEKILADEGKLYSIKYDDNTQTVTFTDDAHGWNEGMCLLVTVDGHKHTRIVHFVMRQGSKEVAFLRPLSLKQWLCYLLNKVGFKVHVPRQKR